MSKNKKQITYTRFLKDKKFIEWKLFSTNELKNYWEDYLTEHPEEKDIFHLAEKRFKIIKFTSYKIPEDKKRETIINLKNKSLKQNRRRKIKTVYSYVAAAVVGLLFIVTLFYFYNKEGMDQSSVVQSYILGNELKTEDIQLVTSSKTSRYQENVNISIINDGTAKVKAEKDTLFDENLLVDNLSLNKLIVPYGKRTTLTLSDGTKVWLNSGTILEFPSGFNNKSRDIYLTSGEIFVEAVSDKEKPFYVHTGEFDVKLYGTSFNVSVYEDSFPSVVLVDGSVSLKLPDVKEELFISPNEQATLLDNGKIETKIVDVNYYVSWKNGYLIFDNTPMSEVLRQIGRYYNLYFDFDQDVNIQNRTCTGKISLTENLDVVMTTISILSLTNYEKDESKIIITNN